MDHIESILGSLPMILDLKNENNPINDLNRFELRYHINDFLVL